MFKPELYERTNSVSRNDTLNCLKKYASKENWKDGDTSLDIGCGDGSVTVSVLGEWVPRSRGMLVGSDVSGEMVDHAARVYSDQTTSFMQLDIAADVPQELTGTFNHVFSFFAIHWVQDQQNSFTNICKLLTDGGYCFLVFPAYSRVYDFYKALAPQPAWSHLLKHADDITSPYQDVKINQAYGRKKVSTFYISTLHIYEEEEFKKAMEAISPFKVPAEQTSQILDDYMQVARDLNIVKQVDNKTTVDMQYSLIIARGTK